MLGIPCYAYLGKIQLNKIDLISSPSIDAKLYKYLVQKLL